MAEQFYTILTVVGKAKIANATALGEKVNFTHLALGDGNGKYYNPTESQTELVNEVWRGDIGSIVTNEENSNWIVVQTLIPGQVGGFMIREAGIFDDTGDLIAIAKYPETYKPTAADGSTKDLTIRIVLEVSNTASVTLKVDPTVVLVTQKQVAEAENRAKTYAEQRINDLSGVGRTTETVKKNADDIASLQQTLSNITPEQIGAETPAGAQEKVDVVDQKVTAHLAEYAIDKQKLDGIEEGAEKNLTAQQLLDIIKTVDGKGSGLDADRFNGYDFSMFYSALYQPCVFGKYTGDGSAVRVVNIGFRPDAILVAREDGLTGRYGTSSIDYSYGGIAYAGIPAQNKHGIIIDMHPSGFNVYYNNSQGRFSNTNGQVYHYIAWR